MTIGTFLTRREGKWLLGLVFWTLLGLSFASQFYLSSAKADLGVTWKQAVSYSLGDWYVFGVLSIPAIQLARRLPFESGKWRRSLAVHALASALFSLAYIVLRAGVGVLQSGESFEETFRRLLVKTWHFNLLIYWVIFAISQGIDYYRKYRERELRAAELERSLVQAKLQALQMQLNPHFLFNTLHSISSLMHKDIEAADQMIARLSDLLRAALQGSSTQEVELREELELLQRYLEIEQIRFGGRLTIKVEVTAEALEAQVPNLLLQPLVENAICHGIAPLARPGRINVRAHRDNGELNLEVSDDGRGLAERQPLREGVGLTNTRARLRELYGPAHQFELVSGADGGLRVAMRIPFRTRKASNENSHPHSR